MEGATKDYNFSGSMLDLLLLSGLRVLASLLAMLVSFAKAEIRPEYPFNLYHQNGDKKSREELEEESLEQSFYSWFNQHVKRPAFACELIATVSSLLSIVKCLVRLNVEVGIHADAKPIHPIFWVALALTALLAALELVYVDSICTLLGEWGHEQSQQGVRSFVRSFSSTLSLPLLADNALENGIQQSEEDSASELNDQEIPAVSDIGPDSNYKANWRDVLSLCLPDANLLCAAFIFLLLAAAAQVYIPKFTGAILDALAEAFSGDTDDDGHHHASMKDIPGFMSNVKKLIIVSLLGGVFSGVRGAIFTVVSVIYILPDNVNVATDSSP